VPRPLDYSEGGYGDPLARGPSRVMLDVLEEWETEERSAAIYGVILSGSATDESLAVDAKATQARRLAMAPGRGQSPTLGRGHEHQGGLIL
jgi:hypothetical protein